MTPLIAVDEIEEGGARGIEINNHYLFAVRKEGQVYLYRNACPHLGTPLDWEEHKFLNPDGELIQCSNHGALFRIEDGFCLSGPCPGKSLQAIPFVVEANMIQVEEGLIAPRSVS